MNGRRICHNDCFVVYGLSRHSDKSPEAGALPRFGLIVSKKVDKRATRRNRIKRRIREIIRTVLLPHHAEHLREYRAIVIIARSGCLSASFQEMESRLTGCFRPRQRIAKPS